MEKREKDRLLEQVSSEKWGVRVDLPCDLAARKSLRLRRRGRGNINRFYS